LTDDRDARRVALAANLAVSGTLGTLVRLVDREILTVSQADGLLAGMKQHGYHSPVDSLTEL
jgi:predicted nucleic acid-binding protein